MQGIGNDYVYLDCTKKQPDDIPELAKRVSDRRFGIGADGLILICSSDIADFRMDMYNADGSRGRMCGNGIRCVAKYVHDRALTDKTEFTVETLAGIKRVSLTLDENGQTSLVRVGMGAPELRPEHIPVRLEGESVINREFQCAGSSWEITCVSMGNPHCVVFTDDPYSLALEDIGPSFENDPIFPERVNTEFVSTNGNCELTMRVWERGSGETYACGTGACAVLAAAVLCGRIQGRSAVVHLRGGDLKIEWDEASGEIFMTGPAEFVFDGNID